MPEAYIIDAKRTPVGRRKGGLAAMHPADMGAHAINAVLADHVDPADIDDVVFGCLDTVGAQAGDIARTCWLAGGLPEHVPGTTIDRQCGSSQQALHFAAQGVMSGTQDLVIAGGVQNMSQIPIGYSMVAARELGQTDPYSGSVGWVKRYGNTPVNQFNSAEMMAEKWGFEREDLERFALRSHDRAIQAQDEGRFDREIAAVGEMRADEGPRRGTTMEKMATLKTVLEGGRHSAAACSQISDGAAAILVASEQAVRDHGLTPRARVHHISVRAADPIWMLTAPIPATEYALSKAGMTLDQIDLVEINEAFASVAMAWLHETGADPARVNVNGGAIALGHPLGATGAKLMTTLLHELERTGGRYGLQTMCEGGGQANVTIIERLG